ncbi:unnamed protein product [Nippostrongylus brasiliensis]|uniref:MFS domain-containing protein n=1 Tax=Nippostrongylus brasiliensis TaxID=27835 RepID=A0A0N4YA65_NIPBR|nr:unnamed protein product [Nippostrongylus brasiliensis]
MSSGPLLSPVLVLALTRSLVSIGGGVSSSLLLIAASEKKSREEAGWVVGWSVAVYLCSVFNAQWNYARSERPHE